MGIFYEDIDNTLYVHSKVSLFGFAHYLHVFVDAACCVWKYCKIKIRVIKVQTTKYKKNRWFHEIFFNFCLFLCGSSKDLSVFFPISGWNFFRKLFRFQLILFLVFEYRTNKKNWIKIGAEMAELVRVCDQFISRTQF